MNFKLLAASTILIAIGTTTDSFAANKEELATFKSTGQCIECNLRNADISQQDLRDANVEGANLSNANLADSDLRDANFSDSNARKADFSSSDLRNADFSYANVSGTYFCDADLRGVNWKSISYDENTECLPEAALGRDETTRNNSPRNMTENVESVKKNAESVKKTTDTVKDIFKLF